MISVVVLTFNDGLNVQACLESIADLTDDIVIVDSFSTDATLDICRRFGCRIYQNPFINQASRMDRQIERNPLLLR